MSVFTPCEGGVLKVASDCSNTCVAVLNVDSFAEDGGTMAGTPVTGFSLDLSTNHQFIHTLDEFIYVYAFGDRIGELTITGIAFFNITQCASNPVATPCNVYEYYLNKRLSRSLSPSQIQLNGCGISLLGFLTGMHMDIPNPQLPIMQWALRFSVILDQPHVTNDYGATNVRNRIPTNLWGSGGPGPGGSPGNGLYNNNGTGTGGGNGTGLNNGLYTQYPPTLGPLGNQQTQGLNLSNAIGQAAGNLLLQGATAANNAINNAGQALNNL